MITRRQWIAGCTTLLPSGLGAAPASFRFGASEATLGDVNANDARAAIRVWREEIQRQSGVAVVVDPAALFNFSALAGEIRAARVDAFGVTLHEYLQVAPAADPERLILDEVSLKGGHEYLLLVHREQKIGKLADLRGRRLLILRAPTTALAGDWLDTVLAEHGLGPAERFAHLTWLPKLTKVVLPVYFQQADACLTTSASFGTMCELNPQLAAKLTPLARSARLLPAVVGMHRHCPQPVREAVIRALLSLHQSPTGKQVLTLFQGSRLLLANPAALRPSLDLIAAAGRLRAGAGRGD